MNLNIAQSIFKLESRVSIGQLNTVFRELVKKYHPDKVRDHPQWANERMAEINNAYETLVTWISEPAVIEEQAPEQNEEVETPENFAEEFHKYPSLTGKQARIFYEAFNHFLNGLILYFQYGLENPSQRYEGVRRFRYRESIRSIEKGFKDIENCAREYSHPAIDAVSRFVRLMIADIHLGEMNYPMDTISRKMDSRMSRARQAFDTAVKFIFFPEMVPKHLKGRVITGLYTSYSEFILYLSTFESGERKKMGILQTARYDAFMTLLHLRSLGIIEF